MAEMRVKLTVTSETKERLEAARQSVEEFGRAIELLSESNKSLLERFKEMGDALSDINLTFDLKNENK